VVATPMNRTVLELLWAERHGVLQSVCIFLVGVMVGFCLITSSCESHVSWNPLAALRLMKLIEGNMVVSLFAPEASEAVKVASAALLSTGAGAVTWAAHKYFNLPLENVSGEERGGRHVDRKRERLTDERREFLRDLWAELEISDPDETVEEGQHPRRHMIVRDPVHRDPPVPEPVRIVLCSPKQRSHRDSPITIRARGRRCLQTGSPLSIHPADAPFHPSWPMRRDQMPGVPEFFPPEPRRSVRRAIQFQD
jgi:hypothetical protein